MLARRWAHGWEIIRRADQGLVFRVVPGARQGNIDQFNPANDARLGVLWPHFLMNSHRGGWLTDRVESERMRLESFGFVQSRGPAIHFRDQWNFRDWFVTDYDVYCWMADGTVCYVVQTGLQTRQPIPDVSKVWFELMNDPAAFSRASWIDDGRVRWHQYQAGASRHVLGGEMAMLDSIGQNSPRNGQGTSPWLVNLTTAQPAYRYLFDGHVKTVEIHAKPPTQDTNLDVGDEYRVSYLVIVPSAKVQPGDRATITMRLLRDLRLAGTDADHDGSPEGRDTLNDRKVTEWRSTWEFLSL